MILDATNIKIYYNVPIIGFTYIGKIKQGTLQIQAKTRETTRFTTGGWDDYVVTGLSWSITASSIAEQVTGTSPLRVSFLPLIEILKTKTKYAVIFDVSFTPPGETLKIHTLKGNVLLTSVDGGGITGQDMNMNITMIGCGALTYHTT